MSYEIIKSFAIDARHLEIRCKCASSNVTDYYGHRVVEEFNQQYKTQEEFKEHVFGWANSFLLGTAHFSVSSTFAKRMRGLEKRDLIYAKKSKYDVTFYYVRETEEAFNILIGKEKVKDEIFMIRGSYRKGSISPEDYVWIKRSRSRTRLVYDRRDRRGSKFYSRKEAEALLERFADWTEQYELKIIPA